MLEATSYRYEVMKQNPKTKVSLERQRKRIEYDELNEAVTEQLSLEQKANERAEWDEKLEMKTEAKRLKNSSVSVRSETKLAAKCLVEVRRAALKQLFATETTQYEAELSASGKTFYVQRM